MTDPDSGPLNGHSLIRDDDLALLWLSTASFVLQQLGASRVIIPSDFERVGCVIVLARLFTEHKTVLPESTAPLIELLASAAIDLMEVSGD